MVFSRLTNQQPISKLSNRVWIHVCKRQLQLAGYFVAVLQYLRAAGICPHGTHKPGTTHSCMLSTNSLCVLVACQSRSDVKYVCRAGPAILSFARPKQLATLCAMVSVTQ